MPTVSTNDHFIAGSISGFATRMVVAPLDVLKIRFQLQAKNQYYRSIPSALVRIVREEGITALWKGNLIACAMSSPYTAITFTTQKCLKQYIFHGNNDPLTNAICGGLGGMLATSCTYPLDLLRSRFIAQRARDGYSSIAHACSSIYRAKGLRGAFEGISPALVGVIPYMGIQFAVYEMILSYFTTNTDVADTIGLSITRSIDKVIETTPAIYPYRERIFKALHLTNWSNRERDGDTNVLLSNIHTETGNQPEQQPSPQQGQTATASVLSRPLWVSPFAGLVSGMSGKLISFPFDLIKRRMQVHSFSHTFDHSAIPPSLKMTRVASDVFRNEGVLAFYKGITPSLVKSGVAASLSFFFYELSLKALIRFRSKLRSNQDISL